MGGGREGRAETNITVGQRTKAERKNLYLSLKGFSSGGGGEGGVFSLK